jgi:hypothetical protein
MNTYRFFFLVDEHDASTANLATLAHHPEKRAATLKTLVSDQYMLVMDKSDITKCTLKMLEDAFEEVYPVSGATKQKAITFFLKAAKFADMPLSPYLFGQLREGAKKTRRNKPRAEQGDSEKNSTVVNQTPGLSSHTVQLAGGGRLTITISANPFVMPAADRTFFFSIVDMLHKYGTEHPQSEESTKDNEEKTE